MKKIEINKMLKNNIHIGHRKNLVHKSMKKYILNLKKKIHIINLEKTLKSINNIKEILNFNILKKNKKILIVCTKKSTRNIIKNLGNDVNMPYINKRWLGGSLTNFKTFITSINKMNYIQNILKNINFKINKKKRRIYKKKLKKLKSFLEGVENIKKIPEFIFVLGLDDNKKVIKESNRVGVTSIAIVDTNNSTKNIDYVIPGNDDSFKSIIFYIKKIKSFLKK